MAHDSTFMSDSAQPETLILHRRLSKRLSKTQSGESNKSDAETSLNVRQDDLLCPVCFDLIDEAYMTKCGHTFCYNCILRCIDTCHSCPRCTMALTTDNIFPNFTLNDLIAKHKLRLNGLEALSSIHHPTESDEHVEGLRKFITAESANLTLLDIKVILEILNQRKQLLEAESCFSQNKLLLEFLKQLLEEKNNQKSQVLKEIAIIETDIKEVEKKLKEVDNTYTNLGAEISQKSAETLKSDTLRKVSKQLGHELDITLVQDLPSLATRRRRMHAYFNDFIQCYFTARTKDLYFCDDIKPSEEIQHSGLDEFREDLIKFSRYSSLESKATLNYSSDLFNNSTIVSSIEFDKDSEFFAIAGVTKRIKVFDYGAVIRDAVDVHYPCMEMISNSKISCVSWNCYHKGILASSDYEGTVTVWDVSSGQRTKTFQEHEKRCWSVDFSATDTHLIASGSDDARVKLYNLNVDHSVATLEARANICCVKFNPKSSYHLAFGSADHCVHYYDLRNMKEALVLFKGHKKAVSYVKFLNSTEIVSASTDSQLKLWNVNSTHCVRSFVGHANEKNFVGLATDGDYIGCGSENNSLYVYYKGLSRKLFSYKFDSSKVILEQERRDDEVNEFVSAVCWKQHSNVILAANSQGIINILELS